jgi:hypothetical protein
MQRIVQPHRIAKGGVRCHVLDAIPVKVDLAPIADACDVFLMGRADMRVAGSGGDGAPAATNAPLKAAFGVVLISNLLCKLSCNLQTSVDRLMSEGVSRGRTIIGIGAYSRRDGAGSLVDAPRRISRRCDEL